MKRLVLCFVVIILVGSVFSQEDKLESSKTWDFKCKIREIKVFKNSTFTSMQEYIANCTFNLKEYIALGSDELEYGREDSLEKGDKYREIEIHFSNYLGKEIELHFWDHLKEPEGYFLSTWDSKSTLSGTVAQVYFDPIWIRILITNTVLSHSFPLAVICKTNTGEEYVFTMTCNIREVKLYTK